MNELALFAGAGGGILGGHLLGWKTVCACEIEDYPRKVLLQRQRDGILPRFPIWDDITTFDGKPWNGRIDIISGGFPCQDISAAGKGVGIEGKRSGLWGEMARVVCEVSPRFVFVENSPMLTSRGLHRVLGDLAEMGYNARWCVLGADDVGAPHRRKRIWILAYSNVYGFSTSKKLRRDEETGLEWRQEEQETSRKSEREDKSIDATSMQRCENGEQSRYFESDKNVADSDEERLQRQLQLRQRGRESGRFSSSSEGIQETQRIEYWREDPSERSTEPELGRVANGVANRVDRLKAIGNGQVPAVAALAFAILSEGLVG